MDHLYRVVPASHWQEALMSGFVPRCAADERLDRVHLNKLEDVELAARLGFTAEEEPVALEIEVSSLAEHLRWELRATPPEGVWPNLYVRAIPTQNVVRVLTLVHLTERGASFFRIGRELAESKTRQAGGAPSKGAA